MVILEDFCGGGPVKLKGSHGKVVDDHTLVDGFFCIEYCLFVRVRGFLFYHRHCC